MDERTPKKLWGRIECSREESNLYRKIRNLASYPLNDESRLVVKLKVYKVRKVIRHEQLYELYILYEPDNSLY